MTRCLAASSRVPREPRYGASTSVLSAERNVHALVSRRNVSLSRLLRSSSLSPLSSSSSCSHALEHPRGDYAAGGESVTIKDSASGRLIWSKVSLHTLVDPLCPILPRQIHRTRLIDPDDAGLDSLADGRRDCVNGPREFIRKAQECWPTSDEFFNARADDDYVVVGAGLSPGASLFGASTTRGCREINVEKLSALASLPRHSILDLAGRSIHSNHRRASAYAGQNSAGRRHLARVCALDTTSTTSNAQIVEAFSAAAREPFDGLPQRRGRARSVDADPGDSLGDPEEETSTQVDELSSRHDSFAVARFARFGCFDIDIDIDNVFNVDVDARFYGSRVGSEWRSSSPRRVAFAA